MAPFNLSIHDKCQTVLYYIIDRARTHHENLAREPVTGVGQLTRHKAQVNDLISEIKHMLRKYPKWGSGREIVSDLIPIVLRLKNYKWKVFQKNEQYNNIIINKYAESRDEFTAILDALSELYVPLQNRR